MKKIVKKFGNSVCFIFSKDEQFIYDIEVGKMFDVEISEIKQKRTVNDGSKQTN